MQTSSKVVITVIVLVGSATTEYITRVVGMNVVDIDTTMTTMKSMVTVVDVDIDTMTTMIQIDMTMKITTTNPSISVVTKSVTGDIVFNG
jgi:hypothetical protein